MLRVVPRENEAVNEVWISDRDRYSYEGLDRDRLDRPLVKDGGQWVAVDWSVALERAANALRAAGADLRTLVSPSATLEEIYLAQKLTRGLGSPHVDHRLRQGDFRGDAADPLLPWAGQPFAELEGNAATLLVGSNVRKDQPLLGLRLRKAVRRGGRVAAINPVDFDMGFAVAASCAVRPSAMLAVLAGVAGALGARGAGATARLIASARPDARAQAIAALLQADGRKSVLLGPLAMSHPDFSLLRALAADVAGACGATLGFLPEGANATGAVLAGALPHRLPGGASAQPAGEGVTQMLARPRKAVLLLGIEPDLDIAGPHTALDSLRGSGTVVALTAYRSTALDGCAEVQLPVAGFGETSGTFVNAQGDWQGFAGAVAPPGQARPAWKVLRVLGNLTGLDGFDYDSSEQVRDEVRGATAGQVADNGLRATVSHDPSLATPSGVERIGDVPPYAVDSLVRRSAPLQQTLDGRAGRAASIGPALAAAMGLQAGDRVSVTQDGGSAIFPVQLDPRVPDGCVRLPSAVPGAAQLGGACGAVTLAKV